MRLPGSNDVLYSRGQPVVVGDQPGLRALAQLGQVLALPLIALGTGAKRLWSGPTPTVSGALTSAEARTIRRRLRNRLRTLRQTGVPFALADAVPLRWTRLGVFAPLEDIRSHFPAADQQIVDLLQTCDRHVVVLERAPDALVYLIFGPADDIPRAVDVSIAADRIVVSRVSRDCVDYLDFAAAPPTVTR